MLPMSCYMDPAVVARDHILLTAAGQSHVNSVGDVVETCSMKMPLCKRY